MNGFAGFLVGFVAATVLAGFGVYAVQTGQVGPAREYC